MHAQATIDLRARSCGRLVLKKRRHARFWRISVKKSQIAVYLACEDFLVSLAPLAGAAAGHSLSPFTGRGSG